VTLLTSSRLQPALLLVIVILSTVSFFLGNGLVHAQGTTSFLATAETSDVSAQGVYVCDLNAGTSTKKVSFYADFLVQLSSTTCLVTKDEYAADGGGVSLCDLTAGTATKKASLDRASGIVSLTSSSCLVTSDNDLANGGGIYLCDLDSGTCTKKVSLDYADFVVLLSSTTCLVTSDNALASGGGIYLCDLNAGTATKKVSLVHASGLAIQGPVVGGVLVPVNELELLRSYLGLAGLAMAASAVVVVKRRSRR
jgi:hypothetical protein